MLWIRREQMDVFQDEAERRFCERLAKTMPDSWPALSAALGPAGIEDWVRKGFDRAKEHGFTDYDNISRFIHLMFMLTNDKFDTDPNTDWAAKILGWKGAPEGMKIAALEKKARSETEAL